MSFEQRLVNVGVASAIHVGLYSINWQGVVIVVKSAASGVVIVGLFSCPPKRPWLNRRDKRGKRAPVRRSMSDVDFDRDNS
jgi:hypothetical protein